VDAYKKYTEFKELQQRAERYHAIASQELKSVWTLLSNESKRFDPDSLGIISRKVRLASDQANKAYLQLVARYPKSIRIHRQYGLFLLGELRDRWQGHTKIERSTK
jgi:hypothetical protein